MELTILITGFLAVAALTSGVGLVLKSAFDQTQTFRTRSPWLEASRVGVPLRVLARVNQHPRLHELRESIESKLIYAGRPGTFSAAEFLGVIELTALGVFLLVTVLLLLSGVSILSAPLFGLFSGLAGGWLVYAWLDHLVVERRIQISRQFPYFLDLAVMTMEAGSSFEATVDIYVRDNEQDVLSDELRFMRKEVQMGKRRDEALLALRDRTAAEEVRNAISATVQGSRSGTPLGQVLREQADTMRFKRSQLAERAAEELKIRIMGPTVLMMIAVFLLILGPVFINVSTSGIL